MTTPATELVEQLRARFYEIQGADAVEVTHPGGRIERAVPDLSTLGHFQRALGGITALAQEVEADYARYQRSVNNA